MPDETPSGGTTTPPDPAAQGSDTATSQTPADNPEAQRASREAAKYRTQLREREQQLANLTAELEELKTKSKSAPAEGDASEVAAMKRQIAEMQKTMKDAQERASKAEEASRQEKLDNALIKAISEAGVLDPEDAAIIARTKGRARIADDGKPVFVISENGEEREVVITASALKQHKLVPDRFFPAEGAAGAGSRGGARGASPNGLDFNRGLNDPVYFAAHEKEMRAEMQRRASAT